MLIGPADEEAEVGSGEQQPLIASQAPKRAYDKRFLGNSFISVFNGTLYFAIAIEGGENIKDLFGLSSSAASDTGIIVVSAGASLVYTMFTFKTLEALSLKIDSASKVFFSLLSPFAAAAFLTAGESGAKALNFDSGAALTVGITLFSLRIINGIDASVKFPERLRETKVAWNTSMQTGDYAELARLVTAWAVSIGYAAATTDAIYNSTETVAGWFGVDEADARPAAYIFGVAGAVGSIPLTLYWSYRGIRQLTRGGKENPDGTNPDPTDRYAYAGLIFVAPVMLGILGGATAAKGAMFGKLGMFAEVTRTISSSMYAIFAGTPGMATLLRGVGGYCRKSATSTTVMNSYSVNTARDNLGQPAEPEKENKRPCSIM